MLTIDELEFRFLLNLREVAKMIGITPEALRDRVRRGSGCPPALRTGSVPYTGRAALGRES